MILDDPDAYFRAYFEDDKGGVSYLVSCIGFSLYLNEGVRCVTLRKFLLAFLELVAWSIVQLSSKNCAILNGREFDKTHGHFLKRNCETLRKVPGELKPFLNLM